jgi:hypothetical protein
VFNLAGNLSIRQPNGQTDIIEGVRVIVEPDKIDPQREDPVVGFHFILELDGTLKQFDTTGRLELYVDPCQQLG